MSHPIRFVMLGGFLGAGKTTLIGRMAKSYIERGLKVAVVTNDQAAGLVDTELLRSQGLNVNEVSGSCFCCNFDGLTEAMENFEHEGRPDIILAEPVGSCTDLIATIAIPMMQRMNEKFIHAPYAVVLKPSHGRRILSGRQTGFSAKAEYIFRKQLEEAEIVVLNRIDELSDDDIASLQQYVFEQYPGRQIIGLSARTGENVDELVNALERQAQLRETLMDVDYDIYAEGEAELGWLNATTLFKSETPFKIDDLATHFVNSLKAALKEMDAEPAHLKVLVSSGTNTAVANLICSDSSTMLSVSSECETTESKMIVNARVRLDPDALKSVVEQTLASNAGSFDASLLIETLESFRPGRPVPTHRVTTLA